MLIEVKEFQGLATKADPTDIGLEYSRQNQNFSLDTPGTLTKHDGRGSAVTVSSVRLTQLQYWSPSNLDTSNAEIPAVWVGFDDHNNKIKLLTKSFGSPSDLGGAIASVTRVDLNDHGQDFRISADNLTHPAKILQHISRKYFEGNDEVNEYVFQDATPVHPTTAEMDFQSLTAVTLGADTGLTLADNTYNYKLSPIYDGAQELPLDTAFKTVTMGNANKCNKISIRVPNQSGSGTAPNKTYAFNPRITSIKIYRETGNDDNYYQVGEVPVNTKNDTDNIIFKDKTVYEGDGHVFSNTFIDNYSSLTASDGVFSMPNVTTTIPYNNLRVSWHILMPDENGTLDSFQSPGNSPIIYGGSTTIDGTNSSGNTWTFTADDGPLNDSTFLALLEKGIAQVQTGSQDPDYGFNAQCKIHRIYFGERTSDNVPSYTGETPATNATSDLFNVVWHDKALIYDIDDDDRFGINGANGYIAVNASGGQRIVLESVGKAVRLDNIDAYSDSDSVDLYKDYVLTRDSTHSVLHFYDLGYTNSFLAPFLGADIAVDTRYKFSQMIGDIHFVGNVQLDPNGNPENHPDFVMYSEPGQPDIIPSANFIRILDQQGGFINGLDRILNNLVVFMTRGVFRLDVSSGDPSLFTLLEVNTSVGCIAPESIVNAKDNLFFCANDNMFQIRPDFTFVPITKPIEDIYQGIANKSSSKVLYDIKRDRLICRFGNTSSNIYAYDLIQNVWTKYTFTDLTNFKTSDFFTINDELDLFGIGVYDTNPSP